MTDNERQELLTKAGNFFRTHIATAHLKNLKKLKKYKSFDANPFLTMYLSYFLTGEGDAQGIARALLYPRILGTSISTSFGSHIQRFCSEVLGAHGSVVGGLDIEFIDQIDGRRKYCQIKSGPKTINRDDVKTITDKFRSTSNLARQNNATMGVGDLVVGVLYGTTSTMSAFYKEIAQDYTVWIGDEFWYHFTGDSGFYAQMIEEFGSIAQETDAKELLEEVIQDLAKDIQIELIEKDLHK